MRGIFVMLTILLLVTSCSKDIEDSRPGLQSFINNTLFRAIDATAARSVEGGFLIEGFSSQAEFLQIRITDGVSGAYELGGASLNMASFKDVAGNEFRTNPSGEGQVVITDLNMEERHISGRFDFTAK